MSQAGAGERDDGRSWRGTGRHNIEPDSRTELGILRVETKLDGFMQLQQIRDENVMREIKHLRETHVTTSADHESRIRNLEGKRYVEPKTVWTAFSILTTIGSLIIAIVNVATR